MQIQPVPFQRIEDVLVHVLNGRNQRDALKSGEN